MHVPGVAKTETVHMSKALKAGGRIEPKIFTRMFDEVLERLEGEWGDIGLGFTLPDSGLRIPSVAWVDNNFLLAVNKHQYEFMSRTLTNAIFDKYGWVWKPSSMEILAVTDEPLEDKLYFGSQAGLLTYKIVNSMVAVGGVLDPIHPDQALLRHRLGK